METGAATVFSVSNKKPLLLKNDSDKTPRSLRSLYEKEREDHLSQLVIWFEKYFQNENIGKLSWIQDPFNSIAPTDFDSIEEESLIELYFDNSLKAIIF